MDSDLSEGRLTPTQTARLLRSMGHVPNRRLGQNFLVDANIVGKSLDYARVCPGDAVVEVGPGLGTLTGALLARGARVYAVELDAELFGHLSKIFAGGKNFSLINADAVERPLADLPADIAEYKIVSNLPYSISTPWLDAVLSAPRLPSRMSLMLQKEAAERFCAAANTGEYSPISVFLSGAYALECSHKVAAQCFYPRPAVDSVLASFRLLEAPYVFSSAAKGLIRKIFLKRRKQIGSIVRSAGADAEILSAWLDSCAGLNPESRPQAIEMRHWKALNEMAK